MLSWRVLPIVIWHDRYCGGYRLLREHLALVDPTSRQIIPAYESLVRDTEIHYTSKMSMVQTLCVAQ